MIIAIIIVNLISFRLCLVLGNQREKTRKKIVPSFFSIGDGNLVDNFENPLQPAPNWMHLGMCNQSKGGFEALDLKNKNKIQVSSSTLIYSNLVHFNLNLELGMVDRSAHISILGETCQIHPIHVGRSLVMEWDDCSVYLISLVFLHFLGK